MSYTYAERKKTPGAKPDAPQEQTARRADAPRAVAPLSAPSRADLSEAMRARMEASFGANLSAVKSSEASNAPLSHVPAAGVSAYGGADAPMSSASASPAAGPMQAKRKKGEEQEQEQPKSKNELVYDSDAERTPYSNPWSEYRDYLNERSYRDRQEKVAKKRHELRVQGRNDEANDVTDYDVDPLGKRLLRAPVRGLQIAFMPLLSPIGRGVKNLFKSNATKRRAEQEVASMNSDDTTAADEDAEYDDFKFEQAQKKLREEKA